MKRSIGLSLAFLTLAAGCADEFAPKPGRPDGGGEADGGSSPDGPDLSGPIVAPKRSCGVELSYNPAQNGKGSAIAVAIGAEWNGWDPKKTPLTGPDAGGTWKATVDLPVGAHGYKIVITTPGGGQEWLLDPKNPYTKYVGGTENSLREVDDCMAPRLDFVKLDRSAVGGALSAAVQYVDGAGGAGLDVAALEVLLDDAPAPGVALSPTGVVSVETTGLPHDKHRLVVRARDLAGRAAAELHVPFWIEAQPFEYRDGLMYFAFTDRFRDGTPGNTSAAGDVDGRANYAGGDFPGITQAIEEGYFDSLGVRTLWLSPPNANPDHSEVGTGGYKYTGYHGYWPTAGREVQKRFGTLADLKTLVKAAHKRGLRVIIDSVLNHVHKESPLYTQHQKDGWFNGDGSCVCGAPGCDWGTHALDCWFQNYLPDVNYESFDAMKAMIDDALFWAREADVDGFRVDAVKHFQHAPTRRLRARLRDEFEHAGPLFYLVGETFDGDRGLINSYIGPSELHAQFDFPVYFQIRDALGLYSTSLRSLEGAVRDSDSAFGTAPMSPFLGNHDVPRFLSTAASMVWNDSQAQAWSSPPGVPADDAGYQKLRLALTFVATQPGVPLVYYGDEYGQPGAGDPDNRRFMKWSGHNAWEQATLDHAKRLGAARKELVALQRGNRTTLWIDDNLYVYGRTSGQSAAVVAINREWQPRTVQVPVPGGVPLPDGTVLQDRLGGPSVTVAGGKLPLVLSAHTSAVYAP